MNRRYIDPDVACNFKIEIDGILAGRFQECSGLSGSIEADTDVKEGGMNYAVHRFVKRASWGDITLKRGFINSPELFIWMQDSTLNTWSPKKNGAIILVGDANEELFRWYFFNALPAKWEGPGLNAGQAGIAVESLTLAVEWVSMELPPEPGPTPAPTEAPVNPPFTAHFDFDNPKHQLKDDPGIKAFAQAALKNDNDIHIHAHTDAVGSPSYNKTLSQKRADDIASALAANGLPASRIKKKVGHGEDILLPCCKANPPTKAPGCQACRRADMAEAKPGTNCPKCP